MTIVSPSHSPRSNHAAPAVLQAVETRMILIAGADLTAMEEVASILFDAGHVPVIGDWFTDPLIEQSGLDSDGDEFVDQILEPLTERLLGRCDALLRIGGPCPSADSIAGAARARGLRVFFDVQDAIDG